ncbi:MAG: GIY-YIG nuclease family protein [Candidatus Poribacteria bacterium]|nr:GIY-YIG nuclease family protein [Candidatus Poribacteria bacterium]
MRFPQIYGENQMGCIYMWTNQVNKKRYIGKCHGDVAIRYKDHIRGKGSVLLKRAIDKYGIANFSFDILHDSILDKFLDNYEIGAIRKYNTVSPNGYNLTYGGEGGKKSEVSRRKQSETRKRLGLSRGENNPMKSKNTRIKNAAAQKGKPKVNHIGKKHSKETRDKISKGVRKALQDNTYHQAQSFFSSLPPDMSIKRKRKIMLERFSDKRSPRRIREWVLKWHQHQIRL